MRNLIIICLAVFIAVILCSCGGGGGSSSSGNNNNNGGNNSNIPVTIGYGNTPGNIMNYGRAAEADGWIYYSYEWFAFPEGLYKVRTGDSEQNRIKIFNKNAAQISLVGDYIYCNAGNRIWRMKTDGTNAKEFSNNTGGNYMQVVDGWIYYSVTTNAYIHKITINGNNEQIVVPEKTVGNFTVKDDWIYYLGADSYVYKRDLNGNNKSLLFDKQVRQDICLNGEYIYYEDSSHKFNRRKIDGTGIEQQITIDSVNWYNIDDDWLYYYNSKDIYRIKMDGTGKQLVYTSSTYFPDITIVSHYIYLHRAFDDQDYILKMNKDGSDPVKIKAD